MNFSTIMATANNAIEQHLFDDHVVDGLPVRGMFDFEDVGSPAGPQYAPILTVTSIDAAKIDKGASFSHDDINYVIGMRHPADVGFVALELERA